MRIVHRGVDHRDAQGRVLKGNGAIRGEGQVDALSDDLVVRGVGRQQSELGVERDETVDDFLGAGQEVWVGLYVPIVVSAFSHLAEEIHPLIEVGEGVLAVAVWAVKEAVRGDEDLLLIRCTQQTGVFGGHIS